MQGAKKRINDTQAAFVEIVIILFAVFAVAVPAVILIVKISQHFTVVDVMAFILVAMMCIIIVCFVSMLIYIAVLFAILLWRYTQSVYAGETQFMSGPRRLYRYLNETQKSPAETTAPRKTARAPARKQ